MRVGELKGNPKNPRKITPAKLEQLKNALYEFGDLSGITFNRNLDQLVTGHQRCKNFDETAVVKITNSYEKPSRTGTVAMGYILHHGERYAYREVEWELDKHKAGTVAANKNAGEWDIPQLTEWFQELDSFDVNLDLNLTMFDEEERKAFGVTTVREHERLLASGENEPEDDEEEAQEEIEEPEKLLGQVQLFNGDSFEVLKTLPDNSIDSIVTDPPYGIRFMGKAWDGADIEKRVKPQDAPEWRIASDGRRRRKRQGFDTRSEHAGLYDLTLKGNAAFQEWTEGWAREAIRVLKPGGYLVSFCGPRTYHRMATGIEDAGFEIRDQLQWLFGSGFPKSLDISKAIDKAAGTEREVVGLDKTKWRESKNHTASWAGKYDSYDEKCKITTPATAAAAEWEGWGTALKPANEPIVLARKPISEKTVAANVLKWGTGGLNIDGCRIEGAIQSVPNPILNAGDIYSKETDGKGRVGTMSRTQGRFPANLILDETAAEMLDAHTHQGDTGGASRFFYVAKSSKAERNMHCRELPEKEWKEQSFRDNETTHLSPRAGAGRTSSNSNHHPTVKPVSLMRYLSRLVTPPNGITLDLFMGSGTSGVAALKEGFRFIGIEREKEYFAICEKRLNYSKNQTDLFPSKPKTILRKKKPASQD